MSVRALEEAFGAHTPPEAVDALKRYVADVEEAIAHHAHSSSATAAKAGQSMLRAGGKRMRPMLAYLSARAVARPFAYERVVQIGAAIEMVHMATLMHDDVIDEADTRRGCPTASFLFGNTAAILSGDVLLAKAMQIMALDADRTILHSTSGAVLEMVEGEMRELEVRRVFDLTEEEHLRILSMKTAAFTEACCAVGGILAGAGPTELHALSLYGRRMGLAFQIADDVLDMSGDHTKTGKPRAIDFREGCATLPLILLRPMLNEEEEAFVRHKLGNGVTEDELDMLCSWMTERGAIEGAIQRAQTLADEAREALSVLPSTPERDVLVSVARMATTRES